MADEQVSITFRTSVARRDLLDEIAGNMKRDRSFVINEAIGQYLWRYEEDKRALSEALADADRGDLVDQDEFFDELERELAGKVDKAG